MLIESPSMVLPRMFRVTGDFAKLNSAWMNTGDCSGKPCYRPVGRLSRRKPGENDDGGQYPLYVTFHLGIDEFLVGRVSSPTTSTAATAR